jgi:hypothetical protein
MLSARIAASLVSPNGHMRIRHLPNFVGINFLFLIAEFLGFSTWKGMTMRIFTASAIVATVCLLGTPAFVQAQGAPLQSETTPPAESSTGIHSIEAVDIKDLQPAVRSKIDNIIGHTSKEDMQSLRKSIDATPAAASALKAKGLSSSQVVAINIADGVLTLVAKTA